MKTLLKTIFSAAALLGAAASMAAGGGSYLPHDSVNIDATDKASLQNGSKYYVNYCLGCHSMKYQRFKRVADDADIPYDLMEQNLMFTTDKIGDQMRITMPPKDAGKWFGTPPPDLSLITRSRSPEWVYNYLRSFYIDESRPWGVNNTVFPSVGMPHVLVGLQGVQEKSKELVAIEKRIEEATAAKNKALAEGTSASEAKIALHHAQEDLVKLAKDGKLFTITEAGEMTPAEFDTAMRDLTNFMAYVADPVKTKRESLGIYVMIFLIILMLLAYAMKKEFWRDIH